MKWLLVIAMVVIGLILVVVLIGLMLPKAHRATRMVRLKRRPEEVFAAITGPQDWRPGVKVTELGSEGGRRKWREQFGHEAITYEEAACEAPWLYRSRIIDQNLPFSGTWTWEIAATDEGCTCRITEDGEVSNPVFRFVSQFILGHTKTMEDYLNAMGKKFGENVKIEE